MNKNMWTWPDSQLIVTAKDYGLEIPYTEKGGLERKSLIESIKLCDAKQGKGNTVVETAEGEVKDIKEEATLKLVKVIFHNRDENDIPYVFVGHNGQGFYIPKDVEVDVPEYILKSCIKDAVEERMAPSVGVDGSINWIKRKVQRYPYSLA